jgi:hypothetical protein
MKVNGNPHHQDIRAATPRQATRARSDATAPTAFAPGVASAAASAAPPSRSALSMPTESTVELASRKLPPGLVRVAARFEAAGTEGRTSGQSTAQAQVARNLQRFAEAHPIADAASPVAAPPDAESTVIDAAFEGTAKPSEPVLG